jgi:hypothetical protein
LETSHGVDVMAGSGGSSDAFIDIAGVDFGAFAGKTLRDGAPIGWRRR